MNLFITQNFVKHFFFNEFIEHAKLTVSIYQKKKMEEWDDANKIQITSTCLQQIMIYNSYQQDSYLKPSFNAFNFKFSYVPKTPAPPWLSQQSTCLGAGSDLSSSITIFFASSKFFSLLSASSAWIRENNISKTLLSRSLTKPLSRMWISFVRCWCFICFTDFTVLQSLYTVYCQMN